MKISDILIGNLRQELVHGRTEYKQLIAMKSVPPPEWDVDENVLKQMQQQVNDGILPMKDYDAWIKTQMAPYNLRMNNWNRERDKYHNRVSHLIRRDREIRGQLKYLKSIGTPSGVFANKEEDPYMRKTEDYYDPLGRIIDQANDHLPEPADHLITSFVGHTNRPNEEMIGIWNSDNIEDAFSDHPKKPDNLLARQQLEQAMAPIKDLLRQRFGDTIPLHRAQYKLTGNETPRRVLSWTASPHFAKFIAGEQRDQLSIDMPIDRIVWITNRANQQEFICLV